MDEDERRVCGTCQYFAPKDALDGIVGECRRYPRRAINLFASEYPKHNSIDWCGEWRVREFPEDRERSGWT